MSRIKDLFRRWQEFAGWLPVAAFVAIAAWLVLGALLPWGAETAIQSLIELTVLVAYALAALGIARLAWRRWRQPMDEHQRIAYWSGVIQGHRGPLVVFCVNALVFVGLFGLTLAFLWPAR